MRFCQVGQQKKIESYLAEFMWRTKVDGEPFDALLRDIAAFRKANV